MLARAGERATAESLTWLAFEQADAQTAALPSGGFDAVFSRFGVMFFESPEAAFQNLAKGAQVEFEIVQGDKGPVAENVVSV